MKFACEWCGISSKNYSIVRAHEKICHMSPKSKNCYTCRFLQHKLCFSPIMGDEEVGNWVSDFKMVVDDMDDKINECRGWELRINEYKNLAPTKDDYLNLMANDSVTGKKSEIIKIKLRTTIKHIILNFFDNMILIILAMGLRKNIHKTSIRSSKNTKDKKDV